MTGNKSPGQVRIYSIREFFAHFHSDDACLEHIMEVRYGLRHICRTCGMESTFHRLARRPAYSCAHCGAHVHPCAGKVFQDTRTPLKVWFHAIYLFVTARHGVSGKELQRTFCVTYKTAWRLRQQIRILLANAYSFEMAQGHVETDGAYRAESAMGGVALTPPVKRWLWDWRNVVAELPPNPSRTLRLFPVRRPDPERQARFDAYF